MGLSCLRIILRTEGLFIIKTQVLCVVHETGYNPAMERSKKERKTYLGVEIIDLVYSGVNITSMDGLSYLQPRLDGLFFKR